MMSQSDRELKEIINSRFNRLSKEVTEVKTEIKIIKNDLSVILTVTFKLLGS